MAILIIYGFVSTSSGELENRKIFSSTHPSGWFTRFQRIVHTHCHATAPPEQACDSSSSSSFSSVSVCRLPRCLLVIIRNLNKYERKRFIFLLMLARFSFFVLFASNKPCVHSLCFNCYRKAWGYYDSWKRAVNPRNKI